MSRGTISRIDSPSGETRWRVRFTVTGPDGQPVRRQITVPDERQAVLILQGLEFGRAYAAQRRTEILTAQAVDRWLRQRSR
jgi:hypothetical protein